MSLGVYNDLKNFLQTQSSETRVFYNSMNHSAMGVVISFTYISHKYARYAVQATHHDLL